MARKYRDKEDRDEGHGYGLAIRLPEYMATFAPDILGGLSIMNGSNTLEYYRRLFEEERRSEEKRPGKDASVVWPYAERLVYMARKFIQLDADEREFVVKARMQKIFWRGESLSFFNTVVTETIMFRELTQSERNNYKKRIWNVAKNLSERHANTA